MSTNTLGLFLRHLALSEEVGRLGTASDHDLLAAYEMEHGQAAFTELVRRHGPMVLRTCRRILGRGPDAEDAFQATFVLLARKATQLRREAAGRRSLSGWLHRVAYQTAVNVLTEATRRWVREQRAGFMAHPDPNPNPVAEATWNEVRPILDAELNALPDEARRLLIACCLQEKTHAEAAAEVGLPLGSVARRLDKARALLAERLVRRGIVVSASLLVMLLEESAKGAGVPAVLLVHTVEAARTFTEQAVGIVSHEVAQLVKGGLAKMAKGWTRWSMALVGWAGVLGAGLIACQTLKAWPDKTPDSEPPAALERPAQEKDKPARTDCFGDPLPPGALARMGSVRLFNRENGSNPSTPLAFSPDGKILASHTGGMTVALWDAATGKEIRRLTTNTDKGYIASLGFSPDGKTLVTVTKDQKVCQWDTATGKLLRTMDHQGPKRDEIHPGRVAFLPDGRMLTAVDFLKGIEDEKKVWGIYVWDVATGKEVRQMGEPKKKRESLLKATAFSPDGKLLATVGEDGRDFISLWDVATGKEVRELSPNGGAANNQVRALTFSRDGKTLAAAIQNETVGNVVSLWDMATGKFLRQMKVRDGCDPQLAISPDGRILVGGDEGHVWEVSTGKEIRSLGLHHAQVALFSPDGKMLAVGDQAGAIRLWDMPTGKEILPHAGHQQCIQAVAYSPDGKTLASVSNDRTLRLWDAATGKELRQLANYTDWWSKSITYSPDGKLLVTFSEGLIRLWNTNTGKEIRHFRGGFRSVTFSPDGKKLAASMWKYGPNRRSVVRGVGLWEVATGKEIYKLEAEHKPGDYFYWPVAFSPDGRMLATPGKDNTVSLLDVASGKSVSQMGGLKPPGPRGDEASVRFLAFSPDGRVLATSSFADDKVRLWEVTSGKEIGQLDGYKHCKDGKQDRREGCVLAFSPDGRMLATAVPWENDNGGADLGITLWEVASGKEIGRLTGHRNVIRTVAFAAVDRTKGFANPAEYGDVGHSGRTSPPILVPTPTPST